MRTMIARPLALLCSGAALLLALPAAAECTKGPFRVKLPAQRLDERVQALAHVTGCFMQVDPALLADRSAPAVRGRLTTEQVVLRSLRGTGLEAAPRKGHWRIDRAQQVRFARRVESLRTTLEQQRASVPPARAAAMTRTLARVETGVARDVRRQGFLSAAERSSYDATLDTVAKRLGRPVTPLARGWVAPAG